MVLPHSTPRRGRLQEARHATLATLLDSIDVDALLKTLWQYRQNSRPGYPLRAMWRAYLASFILNLPHTNALIRALQQDPRLRRLCGFQHLPHRTTFNRFINRLSHHADMVEAALASITEMLKEMLPDLGEEVAVDSTTVRTHSNPWRKRVSDQDASWAVKTSPREKDGKEVYFGYKLHMAVDANHGIPLAWKVTTGKRNDSPELPAVMENAKATFHWFSPSSAMADRGYDGMPNYRYLTENGIVPVILTRRSSAKGGLYGIYTKDGVPTCLGNVPMQYMKSDPQRGHLYRCSPDGCHLKNSKKGGIRHCDSEVWELPGRDLRLTGILRRDSPEWNALYSKRQAVERTFKSLKESRRLERHCVRGLRNITLHIYMALLAYSATVLAQLQAGQFAMMRWQVRKVA